jgi:hypothetical protein
MATCASGSGGERGRRRRWRPGRLALASAALLALSACAVIRPAPDAPEPVGALRVAAPPAPRSAAVPGGDELRTFYASVESQLVASGRMRRDIAPPDAPYTIDDLVRDFERVALYDEYTDVDGRFVHRQAPAHLRRWADPVRVAVMTGGSASPEDAARDRANVAAFTRRLGQITGVDMAISSGPDVNFLVLFMTSEERTAFADQVSAHYPNFAPAVVSALRDTPLDTFCTAYAFSKPDDPATYSAVMVLIRAEHPPFTRLSCVNEEMAQAMGLPNDSPDARPSLFNDSLEFALLTEHDAILLRMLYDPRLRPGMTADEVRPLLPAIARDAQAAQIAEGQGGMRVATN